MGLSLENKVILTARSDRVKCVDVHPTEPWILCSLYTGKVTIWNFETQLLLKTIEVSEMPVRTARFIARKNWIVVGSDDLFIRVYNYNTLEKVTQFEAHGDYIRNFAINPIRPYVLSCSDDMTIKLWDWDKSWKCITTYEGHLHYVMDVSFNPKDPNTFATASLDRTIKVWSIGACTANYTMEGHKKGINCLAYFPSVDRPYLISGADDSSLRVWDYQNKSCIKVLEGHDQNVSAVVCHSELPIIISGSEDGTVKIWNSNSMRLETTYNFSLDRVWSLALHSTSPEVAVGCDDGSIVFSLGKGEPVASMDVNGRLVWTKNNEILSANIIQSIEGEKPVDGGRLIVAIKDLGQSEIFPQTLLHSPNGKYVAICGEGEYVVYSSLGWRNRSFGRGQEIAWSYNSNDIAVKESSTRISVQQNFSPIGDIQLSVACESIFGGRLIGIGLSGGQLTFFDWTTCKLVSRIDVDAKKVIWSPDGTKIAVLTNEAIYVLKYRVQSLGNASYDADEGFDGAFELLAEVDEKATSGLWIGDAFVFITPNNTLSYILGSFVSRVNVTEKPFFIVGSIAEHDRIVLIDKDLNVITYEIPLFVINFESRIIAGDRNVLPDMLASVPRKHCDKVARFLESQGLTEEALQLAIDESLRFDLCTRLKKLDAAFELANKIDCPSKWRDLGDLALAQWKINLAEKCYLKCDDFSSLLLLYVSSANLDGLKDLAKVALGQGYNNIAFSCLFAAGNREDCFEMLLSNKKYAEAAIFARSYLPSAINMAVDLWRQSLKAKGSPFSSSIICPSETPDAFPEYDESSTLLGNFEVEGAGNSRAVSFSGTSTLNNASVFDQATDSLNSPYEVAFSDHMSMEVNTGTGSMRADDLDDLNSITTSDVRDEAWQTSRALEKLSIQELEEEHLFSSDRTDPFKQVAYDNYKDDDFGTPVDSDPDLDAGNGLLPDASSDQIPGVLDRLPPIDVVEVDTNTRVYQCDGDCIDQTPLEQEDIEVEEESMASQTSTPVVVAPKAEELFGDEEDAWN